MTGVFANGAIFFIRDYNPEQNEDNALVRMLGHKETIVSHISWAGVFLGFHTLDLYVLNVSSLLVLWKNKSRSNLYLPNRYNLLMVRLHTCLMYSYLQQLDRHSMQVESYSYQTD